MSGESQISRIGGLVAFAVLLHAPAQATEVGHHLRATRDWALEADPQFQIQYGLVAAPWIVAREHGGVVHLLLEFPPRILRYDMNSETWLAHIPLGAVPTAMALDANGIYVAFGTAVSRLALDGSGETVLYASPFSVKEMLVDQSVLLLSSNNFLSSIDSSSGTLLDTENYSYAMQGLALAQAANKIYARTLGVGPADIVTVSYQANGVLGSQSDSPFHGDYPSAVRTWVFPGELLVADNSGVVYSGSLSYGGSLAGPFDDLAFHAAGPILLRGHPAERGARGFFGEFLKEPRESETGPLSDHSGGAIPRGGLPIRSSTWR